MTTKQRRDFAISCANKMFTDFSKHNHGRGSNWTPDSMPVLITDFVKRQALWYMISEAHANEMVTIALTYYQDNLDAKMRTQG